MNLCSVSAICTIALVCGWFTVLWKLQLIRSLVRDILDHVLGYDLLLRREQVLRQLYARNVSPPNASEHICRIRSPRHRLNAREKLRDRDYRAETTGVTTTGTGFRASLSLAPANPVGSAWSAYTEDSTASMFSGTAVGSRYSGHEAEEDKNKRRDTYLAA